MLTRMFGEPKLKLGALCLNWVEYGVGDKVVTGWLYWGEIGHLLHRGVKNA